MKFTEDFIIQNLYFSVVLLGVIVLFDVLLRFKSPLQLKLYFILATLCCILGSVFPLISSGPDQYVLQIFFIKGIAGVSIVQIFTNLYFYRYKKTANAYSIFTTVYLLLLLYYSLTNESIFPTYHAITNAMDQREFEFTLPFFGKALSFIYLISSNAFFGIYIYNILFKFSYNNIYFRKIQYWTIGLFFLLAFMLLGLPMSLFLAKTNTAFQYASVAVCLYMLLIILYRPNFINKNGIRVAFGQLFNKNPIDEIKSEIFDNHFYSNFYYRNKEASISDFANLIEVSKELIFNYVYQNYSLSFDELVNKNRIDYFVEIIKDPKFKNYTVEALALEVGFSSRQRFYQPFKKYHGGNPSDLIDIFNN